MGLGSFIRKQFLDVLQWTEDGDGVLAWRYPMQDAEIQYGASLTVRDSQLAIFINEGTIADVFGPGTYKLSTRTLPVLTDLRHWARGFESPFKSDVIFFSTRLQMGRRWGTTQPITVRDDTFGVARLRAFGIYAYRLLDAALFYREVSGTRDRYTVDELELQLRNQVVACMTAVLAGAKVEFLDMAANQALMAEKIAGALREEFERYGLSLDSFVVENISLPEALQEAVDTRSSMGITGDLGRYTQYQSATAIPIAAANPGGIAAVGAGLAAGAAMGQAFSHGLGAGAATPPTESDAVQRLKQAKELLDQALITQADYDALKTDILKRLAS